MEFTPTDCPISQKFIEDVFNGKTVLAMSENQTNGHELLGQCVIDSLISELNINGNGNMSDITRLRIKWKHIPNNKFNLDQYPRSVILKRPTMKYQTGPGPGEGLFTLGTLMEEHNHECDAYAFFKMFPDDPDLPPLVRCYHRERMTDEGNGLLVLEDLSDITVSPASLTYDQAISVVLSLASAQSYGIRHTKEMEQLFVRMADMQFNPYLNQIDLSMDSLVLSTVNQYFPMEHTYIIERLEKAVATVKQFFKNYQVRKPSQVLCLGDVKATNLLFRSESKNHNLTTDLAAMIDFQMCHIGNVGNDLAFLVAWGLSANERRAGEQKLLNLFHDTMKSKIPNYEDIWSFESLIEGYKMGLTICALIRLASVYFAARRFERARTDAAEEIMNSRMETVMTLFLDGVML